MAKVQKIAYNCSTRERKNACVSLYMDAVRPNSFPAGLRAGATTCGRPLLAPSMKQTLFIVMMSSAYETVTFRLENGFFG